MIIYYVNDDLMQSMEFSATLIADDGLRYRCTIRDINEKGYMVISVFDDLKVNSSLQLVIAKPHIATRIRLTSIEPDGDAFTFEAISDEPAAALRSKLLLSRTLQIRK